MSYEKGKAPRVTLADIEAAIRHVSFTLLPDMRTTIATVTLPNGYTVKGQSACLFGENFDAEIGQRVALEDAKRQMWPLLGYALLEKAAASLAVMSLEDEARDYAVSKAEDIARVCHEVNRAYCAALGDLSQPRWEDAPEWQRASALNGALLHMGDPHAGPEASHKAWMAEKLAAGWVWGEVKDPDAKTHPCLVPFSDLPREQQAKDFLFRAVVHALK